MDLGFLLMKKDKDNEVFIFLGLRLFGVVIGIGTMQGLYKDIVGIGIITYTP